MTVTRSSVPIRTKALGMNSFADACADAVPLIPGR